MIYRMMGAFFFGAADKLESALKRENQEPEVLILRMRKVVAMDATGLNALEDLYEKLRKGQTPRPERPAHQPAVGDGKSRLHRPARPGERLPAHRRRAGARPRNPRPNRNPVANAPRQPR